MERSEMKEYKKFHCNTCGRTNNHIAKARHTKFEYDDLGSGIADKTALLEESEYTFWVCCGCDSASLEEKYTHAGLNDGYEQIYLSNFWPQRSFNERRPKSFIHINQDLASLYNDIIKAFHADLGVPTAMSIRSLLEGICIDQGITDNIAWKFDLKLQKLNVIVGMSNSIVDGLLKIKFIGDGAAHRLVAPNREVISLAIDLLEALMLHLYDAKFELTCKSTKISKVKL